jgi:hypothetical protein
VLDFAPDLNIPNALKNNILKVLREQAKSSILKDWSYKAAMHMAAFGVFLPACTQY